MNLSPGCLIKADNTLEKRGSLLVNWTPPPPSPKNCRLINKIVFKMTPGRKSLWRALLISAVGLHGTHQAQRLLNSVPLRSKLLLLRDSFGLLYEHCDNLAHFSRELHLYWRSSFLNVPPFNFPPLYAAWTIKSNNSCGYMQPPNLQLFQIMLHHAS